MRAPPRDICTLAPEVVVALMTFCIDGWLIMILLFRETEAVVANATMVPEAFELLAATPAVARDVFATVTAKVAVVRGHFVAKWTTHRVSPSWIEQYADLLNS